MTTDNDIKQKSETRVQKPKNYAVVLVNDDFTTMEFVINILVVVFKKTVEEANALAQDIHKKGKGVAGIYTREIAETKAAIVEQNAHRNEFPLKASIEEA